MDSFIQYVLYLGFSLHWSLLFNEAVSIENIAPLAGWLMNVEMFVELARETEVLG
jgi:hypothetical protein